MSSNKKEFDEKPKLKMKSYTLRLRPDQHTFLKTLENASSLVREAIDQMLINEKRISNERVIALNVTHKELQKNILEEERTVKVVLHQFTTIHDRVERIDKSIQIYQEALNGKIQPQSIGEGYPYVIKAKFPSQSLPDGKILKIGTGDTEENAIINAKQVAEERIPEGQKFLKKGLREKIRVEGLLKAHKGRLKDLQTKFEKLENILYNV